ncbi:hypothetical protein, variant 1 [Aphanomyces invadans]|uniref:PPM-type phosphatase domain-containing protein n=1 Tax=Aphanomyces invadans TaxID=157072 RepID=A0A024TRG4_9STRA|nr:hypothetical protein, variant 1 [Aphanomyces invadans]ETV96745.1 hypothetical protein, variant 1 [Aphanomyces invadans]|eukprot:XP_008874521.1 hypothetical protein, variant 1 [Aphanomyces invadans]
MEDRRAHAAHTVITVGTENPVPLVHTTATAEPLITLFSPRELVLDSRCNAGDVFGTEIEQRTRRSPTIILQPRVLASRPLPFVPRRLSGRSRLSRNDVVGGQANVPMTGFLPIVLKMTVQTEQDLRTSFVLSPHLLDNGIGRAASNAVSIPADKHMAEVNHAVVRFDPQVGGYFILSNQSTCNADIGTYIRLTPCVAGDVVSTKQWPLDVGCRFRVGKSDFEVIAIVGEKPSMSLRVQSGKLAGKTYLFDAAGGTIGRSADNTIHTDIGSTNATFMRLCSAYSDPYRLEIGDQILVSQTCFSVNRFDFGVCENMGARKHMEDAHTIIQDLNISGLSAAGISPQSFFGVFDGHGGLEASQYVNDHLHKNLLCHINNLCRDNGMNVDDVHSIIARGLTCAFETTDTDFLKTSSRPQAGSTATTVVIAGSTIYTANVGDSRTVLSRNGRGIRLSNDHKPSRPDEAQRIRDTGGFIIHGRVMGELAVSRAFGDCEFKTYDAYSSQTGLRLEDEHGVEQPMIDPSEILKGPLVISTPEISQVQITEHDEFILMASDGLFDVFEDQVAVDFIRHELSKCGDIQRSVERLVHHAIDVRGSRDNVTAIVVMLNSVQY